MTSPPGRAPVRTPRQPQPAIQPCTQPVTLPPYAVILHNDDQNSTDHVVRALMRAVPELATEDAARIMWEAHTSGRAVVIVCPLERAELYCDRLQRQGLIASVAVV